jgi:hypothetical protein
LWRWRVAALRPDRKVLPVPLARLALPARLVLRAPRVHRVRKDPSARRVVWESRAQLVLLVLPAPSDPKDRRAKRAVKAPLGLLANAAHPDRKVPVARLVRLGLLGQRVILARPPRFASSLERTA